ncbi:hypothetical protein ACFPM0_25400 [Pseudonocardia sulfidoxydans]|uniref:hypothetical protein n=1 Tax=Pseudonocardia sulfidoxydans TaxID=54011 RepID=UPI00360A6EBD
MRYAPSGSAGVRSGGGEPWPHSGPGFYDERGYPEPSPTTRRGSDYAPRQRGQRGVRRSSARRRRAPPTIAGSPGRRTRPR